ncbi:STE/STE7/MEK1 protein kinase [Exophiala aquamarina CBS 119918]|uniref:STE/STE7/MEK1 protein kinase n=1 Tax=Exophiala aquamarina CBS 119918 TaxID=1182545 RepID=A0A072PTD4_9EURO|nr:STE/STE7/MEK1 protein kinase [Exophiala aquamarina CBS 119918]KEF62613.1 STE/STE7/MEK1 protein kinase [Exophiala aquamarina CBS 119918]
MSDPFKARTLKRKNVKGLALNAPPPRTAPSEGDSQIPGALGNSESDRTDTLEIGLEFKLDLRSEDLVVLKELGAGNGGTVSKVMHASTKVIMARKIIRVDAKENVRKQIVRELQLGHDCSSPYVITFYGAFQNEARDIVLCMEYMDCGSLDRISKDFGPIRVDVLGKITESILGGLVYLYEAHRIMHRDIKPSNVLVNSRGMIKLCDFGVATETVNSVANTFVGTSTYMAPERIQGGAYTIKSDVWSVGLTVMELAIGRFPFDASDSAAGDRASAGPMGILDLLQQIVHEPAPKLPKSEAFPAILDDFIAKCLLKSPDERPTPRELYDRDNFLQAAKRTPVDLQEWAVAMMDRHNRKSYLAPPAPKSLKSDGTTSDSSYATSATSTASFTSDSRATPVTARKYASPTSGDIPLATPQFALAPPSQQTPTGIVERSPPPPLSLQHLSLETRDAPSGLGSRSNRLGYSDRDNIPEPASAIEPSQRPMFPPRTSSNGSSIPSRGHLPSPAMTIRPPPTGPLPPPPMKDLPAPPVLRSAGVASPRRPR